MNEVQEQTLVNVFMIARKEGKRLCYEAYGAMREIVAIGSGPKPQEGDEPEPSLCAYFEDGTYVALYNCDMDDFGIMEGIKRFILR